MMNTLAGEQKKAEAPVTVLLTVYNGMPYLKESVQSILAQENISFAFLIINNGSTDETKEYLETLNDSRITLVTLEKTLGRTEVLNYGLSRISTRYTAIIDADDISAPDRLFKQVDFLDAHEDVVLVGASAVFINEEGYIKFIDNFPEDHQALIDTFIETNPFVHSACMYRTDVALRVGGYPEKYQYGQDFGLWLAMVHSGGQVASIKEPLVSIRQHQTQASQDKKCIELRRKEKEMQTEEIMSLPGLSSRAKRLLSLRNATILIQQGQLGKGSIDALVALKDARLLVVPLLWKRLKKKF